MNFILKAKHWQVFLILLSGLFLHNLSIEGNPAVTMILAISGLLILLLWPLLMGHELYGLLQNGIKLNYYLFVINGFITISVISVITVISDGKGMIFTGLAALLMFYFFYAFLHTAFQQRL